MAPPQGSHDWSAVVRVASLRARQVCKAKDMSACGNSEKGHQQSLTTQGLLDFVFAVARYQGDPWYAPLEHDAGQTLVCRAGKRLGEEVVARTA